MRLKELRKENKKTQTEVAEYLNTTQATYGRYELDSITPPIDALCKLADYYGVTLDYLVGRDFLNEYGYLSDTEKELLNNFRSMNNQAKIMLLGEAKAFSLMQ